MKKFRDIAEVIIFIMICAISVTIIFNTFSQKRKDTRSFDKVYDTIDAHVKMSKRSLVFIKQNTKLSKENTKLIKKNSELIKLMMLDCNLEPEEAVTSCGNNKAHEDGR